MYNTLAIDIGTSSVRAALYDEKARPIRRTEVKLARHIEKGAAGTSELAADAGLEQVITVIDQCVEKIQRLKLPVDQVASCSFWHSLVGVDATGRPTTNVLTWADTQSRNYSALLKQRFNEAEFHDRTGAHFHSSFWPAKLLWLRRERPEVWARTAKWLSFSDYIWLKIFGNAVTSVSMASGTGILDLRDSRWEAELTRFLKLKPDALPDIRRASSILPSRFARRWPLLRNVPWYPTIADGAADNIGSGCHTKQRAALMVGTSGAMRVLYKGAPPAHIPDGLWCYRVDEHRVAVGGALSDGGNLYDSLSKQLRLPKDAAGQIRHRGAAAHGLTFLPFASGERSTGYHEDAAASIIGLTAAHDSVDVLQAAMESVAYRFAEICDRLQKVTPLKEIVASGGALRASPVWTQIIADVLGRDLAIVDVPESSSRGAVLLALESARKIESIDSFQPPASSTLAYHKECHAAYNKARVEHQALYKKIIEKQ